MTNTLNIPLVNFQNQDLDTALELYGARFDVNQVNWPADFPYAPLCSGRIARTEDALIVDFRVSGLDLRAVNSADNGRQWEDSCVEFFVQDPDGSRYYNFEINALGKVLAASGPSREGRIQRPAEEMATILRIADLEAPCEHEGGIWTWRVAVLIPFKLIGIDAKNPPASLKANFYKCGDRTAHPHFLSWNPVGTEKPDFHRPEFFGNLILS